MSEEKKNEINALTVERILEQMSKGKIPWRKDWENDPLGGLPFNYGTGRSYTGVNIMHLLATQITNGYTSSGWVTYEQAKKLGGHVRKGEKCTRVRYMFDVKDEENNPVLDKYGEPVKRAMIFQLYNTQQCEGLEQRVEREPKPVEWRHEQCEKLMHDCGVPISHNGGNRAFYSPVNDSIHLPTKEQFPNPSGYYAVALHEMGHASGHSSRLNRDMTGKFGTPEYAKEELKAEFFSMIVADRLGVSMEEQYDPNNHIAYLQSWMEVIKNDPQELFRAAADAEKMAKFYNIERYARENIIEDKYPEQSEDQKPNFNPKPYKSKTRAKGRFKPKAKQKSQQREVAMS